MTLVSMCIDFQLLYTCLYKIDAQMLYYRELPAALPYIGAYLDQIYSLEMCTKTYNKDGLVNFTKMTKVITWICMYYI